MDKFEQPKKHQTRKDKGSYEVNERGRVDYNPDVKKDEFIKDEASFDNNEDRQQAMEGLVGSWWQELGIDEIFDRDEMQIIFRSPDNFIVSLVNYQNQLKLENFSDYLNEVEQTILQKISQLGDKREQAVDLYADYDNTPDFVLDHNLKITLDNMIKLLANYIDSGQQVLKFIEQKKNEIIM